MRKSEFNFIHRSLSDKDLDNVSGGTGYAIASKYGLTTKIKRTAQQAASIESPLLSQDSVSPYYTM